MQYSKKLQEIQELQASVSMLNLKVHDSKLKLSVCLGNPSLEETDKVIEKTVISI